MSSLQCTRRELGLTAILGSVAYRLEDPANKLSTAGTEMENWGGSYCKSENNEDLVFASISVSNTEDFVESQSGTESGTSWASIAKSRGDEDPEEEDEDYEDEYDSDE